MSVQVEQRPTITTVETKPDVVRVRRRTIDLVLVGMGVIAAMVSAAAGALVMWGSNFAQDYVHDELSSQHVVFPMPPACATTVAPNCRTTPRSR